MDIKSWRTSLTALVTAAAGFVLFSPELFENHPALIQVSKYIMVGGLAGIGIFARDNKVSDEQAAAGQDPKPSIPPLKLPIE